MRVMGIFQGEPLSSQGITYFDLYLHTVVNSSNIQFVLSLSQKFLNDLSIIASTQFRLVFSKTLSST